MAISPSSVGAAQKTLGQLVDELITVSMKCWYHQEIVSKSRDDQEVAVSARLAQSLNRRRNELMNAVDERVGEQAGSPTLKTY